MPGNPKAVQDSFATGVVAPEMSARVGLARYANGLIEGTNCYPTKTGALTRRRGTKFVALTKDSGLITDTDTESAEVVRLLNFDFNEEQTHFIEAGDLYARFGADGGLIIESTTNGTSIVVSGTYQWTLKSGSIYYLEDTGGGSLTGVTEPAEVWEQVLTTEVELTRVVGLPAAAGEWVWGDFDSLTFDTIYLELSDSADPSGKSDGDVVATNYAEITWPYLEAEVFDIDTVQSADVMWAVHPSHPPANVIRTGSDVWEYEVIAFTTKLVEPNVTEISSGTGTTNSWDWFVASEGYDKVEGLPSSIVIEQTAQLDATSVVIAIGTDTIESYEYFPDGRDTIFQMDRVARFVLYRELIFDGGSSGDQLGTAGFIAVVDPRILRISVNPIGGPADFISRWVGRDGQFDVLNTGGPGEVSLGSGFSVGERIRFLTVGANFTGTNALGEGPDDVLPRFMFTIASIVSGSIYTIDYVPVPGASWSRSGLVDTGNWTVTNVFDPNNIGVPIYQQMDAVEFTDNGGVLPDYQDTPLEPNTLFSLVGDYPSVVTFFEQRLCFAATDDAPQALHMSRPGDFNSFNQRGIVKDDDPIQKFLPARQANRVRNLVPLYDLVATTGGAIFRIWSESGVVSARELQLRPQTERGASNLEPVAIFGTSVYVSDKRNQVFLLSQRDNTFGYQDSELSIYVEHYFKGRTVVDWAYAASPDSVLWVVMSDGKFLSFTYIPDQEVWAWAEHETDGWVESITTIREGGVDAVYLAVARTATGDLNPDSIIWRRRTIERMETEPPDNLLTSIDVDCAFTFEADDIPVETVEITFGSVRIVTVDPHGMSDDDIVFLDGLRAQRQSGVNASGETVEDVLNGRRFRVQSMSSNNLRLHNVADSAIVEGANFLIDDTDISFKAAVSTVSGLSYYIDRPDNGGNIIIKHNGVDSATDTEKYQYLVEQDPTISAAGVITLTDPATHFMIGFGYESTATTTNFSTHQEGARQSQGRQTNPSEVLLRVHDTLGLEAATQVGTFRPMKAKENSGLGYDSIALEGSTYDSAQGIMRAVLSGDGRVLLAGEWDGVGRISVKQAATEAVPFTLLAILEEVVHGG
jgi:hypothetical protein